MAEQAFSGSTSGTTTTTAILTVQAVSALQLVNRDPEPDETEIVSSSTIKLDITNLLSGGVDVSNTVITVNGATAYDGGAGGFQTGFDGSLSAQSSVGANGDTERWVIDPTTDFTSLQEIEVCVTTESVGGAETLVASCYTFFAEDLTPPAVASVVAIEAGKLLVTFTDTVGDTALDTANYLIEGVSDSANLVCFAEVAPFSIVRSSDDAVVITTDEWMSFLGNYQLTVSNVLDDNGNAISSTPLAFVGFDPEFPANRDFDIWSMFSRNNREKDASGDLQRWACIVQDLTDQMLYRIDRFSRIYDVDKADPQFLDAMLTDLGNPFTSFVLTTVDKRRLIRVLVEIYKQKGLEKGIKNVVRFLLGYEIEILPFSYEETWVLGESELGFDTELGTSKASDAYTFSVEIPQEFTEEEMRRLLEIVNYMKPGHTHLSEVVIAS